MDSHIRTWLKDILQAIQEIDSFLPVKKDFSDFQHDIKTKRAIERNVEIIGEAMSRILKTNPDFPINHSRKIVDTRNRIVHGYDSVSEEIIWSIVVQDLPPLEKQISKLLEKM